VVEEGAKADQVKLAAVGVSEAHLTLRFEGKALGKEGPARGSATVGRDSEGKLTILGSVVWADGSSDKLTGSRIAEPTAEDKKADEPQDAKADKEEDKKEGVKKKDDKPEKPALYPVNFPLGDFGRTAAPEQPKLLALKNATLWTSGKDGTIEGGILLIGEGKIIAAGKDVAVPDGATVVDATGLHISPGIIDCHSHIATDGGVNESSQAITAEVRIGDFIDADDISIYRQLAGGVTSSNILHGSANPIGGQNQVLKFRWGATGEALKFAEAPPGIKFALGENVKQSNWGERYTTRYPQTRVSEVVDAWAGVGTPDRDNPCTQRWIGGVAGPLGGSR
jgi:N-acetylglucosamine-6-phosphate deacetylase